MATVNKNYTKLQSGYLFSEIAKQTKKFIENNPGTEIIRLGIGNTTQPLSSYVIGGLTSGVKKLADVRTYTGYGDEQGNTQLRNELSHWYAKQDISIDPMELFISDGAKSDSANISSLFSINNTIAVQDPVYPVYVDSNVIGGRTGNYHNKKYKGIVYMPCTKENSFIPSVPSEKVDIIFLCSPNNPTGAVATKQQLKAFVKYALKYKAVIIFDSAYAAFIKDTRLPKSIYEIEGAKKCAIEISSFSKSAGFTGVRLGWTVVPMELEAEDAKPGVLNVLWNRRQTTMFNGASNIAQEGGLAVLSDQGQKECQKIIDYYMQNAKVIKETCSQLDLEVFGGENAPYIWVKTPNGMTSWEFFNKLLQEAHIVSTPGSGFGSQGEGYIRLSAFGHTKDVMKAVQSMKENLKL